MNKDFAMFAGVLGLVLGAVAAVALFVRWQAAVDSRKPKVPSCPHCGDYLLPVEVIPLPDPDDPDHRAEALAADWYCSSHPERIFYFATKPPTAKATALDDGEFGLRAIG
jgi:hypothetical protein